MVIDFSLFNKLPTIDTISLTLSSGRKIPIDILRLDKLHDTISGNKWFKLKYNLLEAQKQGTQSILSFGGAYSNHLHALAYAGKLFGLQTIGIVRGEEVENPTLQDCKNWGMELKFVSRTDYRRKTQADFLHALQKDYPDSFFIPEGGDNALGQRGCKEIMQRIDATAYDLLCCSIGTGTTIQGLASTFEQEIWGFAPFKNAHSLKDRLISSCPHLQYIDSYHFGGFGKMKKELALYINDFKTLYDIQLDRVYTAKMFYGIEDKLNEGAASSKTKILAIHTGGLQGNRSSNS